MKARYLLATAVLAGGAFLALQPAHAGTIDVVWNFNSPSGLLGTTQSYNSTPTLTPAETILASGFVRSSPPEDPATYAPENLYGKNDGGDEIGLGFNNDPSGEHEITTNRFVQLDLSNLHSPPLLSTSLSFGTNSTTIPDEWAVYGTNTAGTLTGATLIQSGHTETTTELANILGTYTYLDVTALSGNILLRELDNQVATGVPEPASLAVLGFGLLGLGVVRRRSRKS